MTSEKDRLQWVDALRGCAALCVAYLHITLNYVSHGKLQASWLTSLTTETFDAGKFGVVLFFCISGYVIPPTLDSTRLRDTSRFIIGRFFRLYPLYWLSIPLALLFPWPDAATTFDTSTVVLNFTMFQGFVGVENVMGLYWTLQVELAFYVVCIGLSWLGALHDVRKVVLTSLAFLIVALVMAAVRFALEKKLPVALPLGLSVMFWASSLRLQRDRYLNSRNGFIALAVLIPIVCILAYSRDYGFNERWDRYVATYYAAIAIFALAWRTSRPAWRPLAYLGTISYSLYLLHPTVFAALREVGIDALLLRHLPAAAAMAVQIAVAVGVACVTYSVVEKPFHNIGRLLQRRVSGTWLTPLRRKPQMSTPE